MNVAGGPTLLHTTFGTHDPRRQAYPDTYPGGDHLWNTGAAEVGTLGYTYFGNAVYKLSFTFPHSASSLVLTFSAPGLQGLADESWGLDNVAVSIVPFLPTPTAAVLPFSSTGDLYVLDQGSKFSASPPVG